MRIRNIEKKITSIVLTAALLVSAGIGMQKVKAVETGISFAKNDDGAEHENSFELARVSDDTNLSSYEEENGKHWVKLFSNFDGEKNIFDGEEIPDGTAKMKVVFDITNYDLDQAYPLTWATGIGGWAGGKPTGVTINQSGTYEALLDFASETDGIGRPITSGDINAASIQLVFQLGESGQSDIVNVKKIKVSFKACYAYEEGDTVEVKDVQPIEEPTKEPEASSTPAAIVSPTPTAAASAAPTMTAEPKRTESPFVNKVKTLKAVKNKVSIRKGKKANIAFKITTATKNQKTTDKITKAAVSNKKIAKVLKKSLGKNKCTIQVRALKKGKTKLTVKVGGKKAKVTISVK